MKFKRLIAESKMRYEQQPHKVQPGFSVNIFYLGAKWMFFHLNDYRTEDFMANYRSTNFAAFGILKYGICLAFSVLSFLWFLNVSIFWTPLSIILFYIIEVHFLFLFPLLLDKVKNPLLASIKQTYRIGYLEVLITTILIGLFMIRGLFNLRDPLRNWHIGCLSIIIWYQDEVRNRI